MDCQKVGELILSLRKEKNLTQKQLADRLNISDKTISKWERGLGCPDVSLLVDLSRVLDVDIEKILSGNLDSNEAVVGNMKRTKFYVCHECGNVMTSTSEVTISCCGRKLNELTAVKASEENKLNVETIDNDWYVSSDHEMTKEHFISFIAFVTGDRLVLVKQYPEWKLGAYFQKRGRGILYSYCTRDGLMYQYI